MGDTGSYPANCPSLSNKMPAFIEQYKEPLDFKIAHASAICGPNHDEGRIEKTIRFAKECGFKKIGLAFCVAVKKEAEQIARLLLQNEFQVESVVCKVGHCNRSEILGVESSKNAMCNPVAQAELLNEAGTELNLVLGLCVGHDSLFIRHSNAPVSILAVKDHLYNHAPLEYLKVL